MKYRNAHNKVIVIDAEGEHPAVITGSFNFTDAAQRRNAENVVIVRDFSALASAYTKNWQRHKVDALPYYAAAQLKTNCARLQVH